MWRKASRMGSASCPFPAQKECLLESADGRIDSNHQHLPQTTIPIFLKPAITKFIGAHYQTERCDHFDRFGGNSAERHSQCRQVRATPDGPGAQLARELEFRRPRLVGPRKRNIDFRAERLRLGETSLTPPAGSAGTGLRSREYLERQTCPGEPFVHFLPTRQASQCI